LKADDVVEVLGRLRVAGIEFWVEGGWGVDALLGEQTRAHDDLDLGVRLEDVDRICAVLSEFSRSDEEWPASFVMRDRTGRTVDCHPLRFDEHGDGWQANTKGGAPYRWPRQGLQARGRIAGVDVPCISPELQLHWRTYPEFDDVDWQDVQQLCRRFGLDVPRHYRERPGFTAPKRASQPSLR
jgi:lincosamide nucleotidyltransferase A/C/D/E